MRDSRETAKHFYQTTEEDLANFLQNFFAERISKTNDWQPLAEYILQCIGRAIEETENTKRKGK